MLRSLLRLLGLTVLIGAGVTAVLAMAPTQPVPPPRPSADSVLPPGSVVLGVSGKLRAFASSIDSVYGIHPAGMLAPDGGPMQRLAVVPLEAKRGAVWRGYRVGFWPGERERARAARYALPTGFLEVTPETVDAAVSQRFRFGDFLTHDQAQSWPKVLVLRLPLVDKLELIADRLAALGRSDVVRVMSGFRTPQYNVQGVGRGGRARDSRHMYGDAADIYVDGDGNGRMDDLDRDGRVTISDARWLSRVVEDVGAAYPELTGGIGVYRANAVHGPFVHVDIRGVLVRW